MAKRIGLLGYPIGHSRSPRLFREYFADRPDILDEYTYELVETPDFGKAFSFFRQRLAACNVTSPFKDQAYSAADGHSYMAERAEAANLLVKEGGKIMAYNTDSKAVGRILRKKAGLSDGVLVIGCGGAGKAAAVAALECGMRVSLANRTLGKAEAFAEHLLRSDPHNAGSVCSVMPLESIPDALPSVGTVILALPSGVYSGLTFIADCLKFSGKTAIEAAYKDPMLSDVPGIDIVSGLEWLELQAEETYRIVIGDFCVAR